MTNPQKAKGDRAELELARMLTDKLGTLVRRKLGAGRQDDTGDLEGLDDWTIEAKNYANITTAIRNGLLDLENEQANAETEHGVLFVRRRGGDWIAVQTLDQWCVTYQRTLPQLSQPEPQPKESA